MPQAVAKQNATCYFLVMEYKMVSEEFRSYLQTEYTRRCQKNPQYSLRSFAKHLEIDPSSLSQFLRKKRNLSDKKMAELGKKLNLNSDDFFKFVARGENDEYQMIKVDQFSILSEWYHLAICQLSLLQDFRSDAHWIARRLGIQVMQAQAALDRLVRIGWMEEEDGVFRYVGGNLSTMDHDITTEALRSYQKEMLYKAEDAINYVPLKKRSSTGVTMAISSEKLEQAKAMIGRFRRKISKFLEEGETKDEVYHIYISLFPLTNTEDEV
jgi:transcriptional regulator with XRE-family HTH domain